MIYASSRDGRVTMMILVTMRPLPPLSADLP
jgi:hypothetical protein